jgi:hypothetical protein
LEDVEGIKIKVLERKQQRMHVSRSALAALVAAVVLVGILAHRYVSDRTDEENVPLNVSSIDESIDLNQLEHLILSPCHGVYRIGMDFSRDSAWYFEDFMRNKKSGNVLMAHIEKAVELLGETPKGLLVFSGGQTKFSAGPLSESQSYWKLAESQGLLNDITVRSRVTTEEFARDSFENLLFSLCRFKEFTGRYPKQVTVVGFPFKEHRFKTLHRKALNIPESSFSYVDVFTLEIYAPSADQYEEQKSGEFHNAFKHFQEDPYGCLSPVLIAKRQRRDPFHRFHSYERTCPEMTDLLQYCGKDIFPGKLPWSTE